ncbi:LOW QUALITY PROTEIN: small nuclear ribonucleoprotein E-like [Ursus arctos]|uniref:LOW QUALITY PROTEIN: small nuclear ribonucleoprotein E-like n=1 Tax=Ursus arctos TaxID=9644 RepID=UPI0025471C72|nr:LOW QUALITY PROTEIN: small nuclear ribonucleoprotein E-like [Ursus arctos]
MTYRGQDQKVQKVMVHPIILIFRSLQNRFQIQVWLHNQANMRIEGCINSFDEYVNLVLDDAKEIHYNTKSRKQLGQIMLEGDNITLLQSVSKLELIDEVRNSSEGHVVCFYRGPWLGA